MERCENIIKEFNESLQRVESNHTEVEEIVESLNIELSALQKNINDFLSKVSLLEFDSNNYYNKLMNEVKEKKFPEYDFATKEQVRKELGYISKNRFIEIFNKDRMERRLKSDIELEKIYNQKCKQWGSVLQKKREEFEHQIKKDLEEVEERKIKFQNSESDEINEILNEYKESYLFDLDPINLEYDPKTKTCIVDFEIGEYNSVENVKKVKYDKNSKKIVPKYYSDIERNKVYEKICFNQIVGLVFMVYAYIPKKIEAIIINCGVTTKSFSSGHLEKRIITSAIINKDALDSTNFREVDSLLFLKSNNVRYKPPLSMMNKINPYARTGRAVSKVDINYIDFEIDGFEFEKLAKDLLEADNFERVEITKSSGDFGADVVAYKEGIRYAIQCKKYNSSVGVSAIQEVIGSKSIYNCHVGAVLTNSTYTAAAISLAEKNNIILWDRQKLKKMLEKL